MAIYAVGDIQGCFSALENLLNEINFDSRHDTMWFTGDLVNRGPESLEVLRFVKSLGDRQVTVLGNHDLHLLAIAHGVREPHHNDTLEPLLSAPDKNELIEWLRFRPLMHYDASVGYVMVHAGIAPHWSLGKAQALALEVEAILRSEQAIDLLSQMYGNQPNCWGDDLLGVERWRIIINYFTRMRFCDSDGCLEMDYKGDIANKPSGLIPWYEIPFRANAKDKIIFGHWAALNGMVDVANIYPLDTGCVWGNCLTAMRLNDGQRFSVRC